MDLTLLWRSGVYSSDSLSDKSPKVNGVELGEIESSECSLAWLTLSSMQRRGTDSFTTKLLTSSLICSSWSSLSLNPSSSESSSSSIDGGPAIVVTENKDVYGYSLIKWNSYIHQSHRHAL